MKLHNIRIHNLQPFRNHYQQSTKSTTIYLPTRIVGWLLFKNEFSLMIHKCFFFAKLCSAYLIAIFTIVVFKVHNDLSCLLNLMKTCFHSVKSLKTYKNLQCLCMCQLSMSFWHVSTVYSSLERKIIHWQFEILNFLFIKYELLCILINI